jgi:hypothetical protein
MEEVLMKVSVAAVVIMTVVFAATANAQNASPPMVAAPQTAAPQAAPQATPQGFPGLGEIMTLQQLRHIKLWFAGQAGNWPLAEYEIGELEEGFDDVNKLLGGDTVDKQVGAPMKALEKIVENKDHAGFAAAFDGLSAGCNSCHHLLDHAFIAIQRPTLLPYSDQSFAPHK